MLPPNPDLAVIGLLLALPMPSTPGATICCCCCSPEPSPPPLATAVVVIALSNDRGSMPRIPPLRSPLTENSL